MLLSIFGSIFLVIMGTTFHYCGSYGIWIEKNIVKNLKKLFMFNMLIRAQLFGYVYFILAGIKKDNFEKNLLEMGSLKQAVNSFMYYFTFAYCVIYPINVSFFLLLTGTSGLKNKRIQSYFGALYDGLHIKNIINTQTTTLFLLRRLMIGVSIAFFREYYFLQLEILLITSLFFMCFTIIMMPYSAKLNNFVEILNEFLVIITVYLMHGFSYFVPSFKTRYNLGWVYISIVITVFLMNLAVIFHKGVSAFI